MPPPPRPTPARRGPQESKKGNTSLLSQQAAQSRHSYAGRAQGIRCAATVPTGGSIPALSFFLYRRDGVGAGLAGPMARPLGCRTQPRCVLDPGCGPRASGAGGGGEHLPAGTGVPEARGCGHGLKGAVWPGTLTFLGPPELGAPSAGAVLIFLDLTVLRFKTSGKQLLKALKHAVSMPSSLVFAPQAAPSCVLPALWTFHVGKRAFLQVVRVTQRLRRAGRAPALPPALPARGLMGCRVRGTLRRRGPGCRPAVSRLPARSVCSDGGMEGS